MTLLLSRYADAAFWLARYIERAENAARLIDVNETFAQDDSGNHNWASIIEINADMERFNALHDEVSSQSVLHFTILEETNPDSILNAVRNARRNARTLRPMISTEMWSHVNIFHGRVNRLTHADLELGRLNRLCSFVKESCQAHAGVVEGTLHRDEAWYFYQIGRHLERADQSTRLLDIKFHLLTSGDPASGDASESRQWNAVLRSAAGYHAFRRIHMRGMNPLDVATFLIHSPDFPRSVALNVTAMAELLTRLRSRFRLRRGTAAMERLDEIQAALLERTTSERIDFGLNDFLDWLQRQFSALTTDLGEAYFGYAPAAANQSQATQRSA
ncbi:alpha-E domain-containing protein [Fodinicurvata sp. EGI_FJ10296]|uniref:alpha-E domain-containing protein n=1 Tax=Fodinicurvata sp. EGI_FJ10296 TaxID=3231908 RepID=UPI0034540BA8